MVDAWIDLAENRQLAEAVIEYVREEGRVTFALLVRQFSSYTETGGNKAFELEGNVVIWEGMSDSFIDLILKLLDDKKLFPWPSSPMEYLADRGFLRYPLVRDYRKYYKKPHWLPTVLRVVPLEGD